MSEHSLFSASAAPRWLNCPGSLALSQGAPRRSSIYSAEGTVAHSVLEALLKGEPAPAAGTFVEQDGFSIEINDDMLAHVRKVADEITTLTPLPEPEKRVYYNETLGVELGVAFGTTDASGMVGSATGNELHIHDLKYGRGEEVSATENDQMRLYALGELQGTDEGYLGDTSIVRMFIHQPRVSSAPSEWSCTVAELRAWGKAVARPAAVSGLTAIQTYRKGDRAWEDAFLRPGAKQCRWCPAKADCPALARDITSTVSGGETDDIMSDFTPVSADAVGPDRGAILSKLDLIEDWCAEQRSAAFAEIQAGGSVDGWKLVEGRKGDRAWSDTIQVEELLRKKVRLTIEEAYNLKLISPTQAEKLHKEGKIGPKHWAALETSITRAPGKPSLAPAADKRPALEFKPIASEFTPAPNLEDDIL